MGRTSSCRGSGARRSKVLSSVRNKDGYWINTEVFRDAAKHFVAHNKRYTLEEPGSEQYISFWEQERERSLNGYEVGGARITGDHYFYLNYCPIQITQRKGKGAKKVTGLPNFWDGDFEYFWICDIARWGAEREFYESLSLSVNILNLSGNMHVILAKARQKGFTAKAASRGTRNFFHIPMSRSIFSIQESKYDKIMSEANNFVAHINKYTGWKKNMDYINRAGHKRASYKEFVGGTPVERGYLSEMRLVLLGENPEALRSITGELVVIDEGGQVIKLRQVVDSGLPGVNDGDLTIGQMVIQGTGGYRAEAIHQFSEFFYNAKNEQFLWIENDYDDDGIGTCGYFFGQQRNKAGYMDIHGNSDLIAAADSEHAKRDKLRHEPNGMDKVAALMAEYSLKPSEMFIKLGRSTLPTTLIKARIERVLTDKTIAAKWMPYILEDDGVGGIKAKIDLEGKTKPIRRMGEKTDPSTGKFGSVMIKERYEEGSPEGLYYIGCDPYAHDQGTSQGTIYVMKGSLEYSFNQDSCVAHYVGRPPRISQFNEILLKMCKLYHCLANFENMVGTVKSYFANKGVLIYLLPQPDQAIGEVHKKSKVQRGFGMHMTTELRKTGLEYSNDYLLEPRDGSEDIIINLDTIDDIGLLQEWLYYNDKDNFDRVDGFMIAMYHRRQRGIGLKFADAEEKKQTFLDMYYERRDVNRAANAVNFN